MQHAKSFDKVSKMLADRRFSFSFLDSFLKIGLISASFCSSGKTPLFTALSKFAEIEHEKKLFIVFYNF